MLLSNLPGKNTDKNTALIRELFEYLRNQVNREDLISNIWENYKKGNYIKAYLDFENFIAQNKPLIVKRQLTKEELREEVVRNFEIKVFPPELRLFFEQEPLNLITFFWVSTKPLTEYVVSNMGEGELVKIIKKVTGTDSLEASPKFTIQEETLVLARLFTALYEYVSSWVGKDRAEELVRGGYIFVANSYDNNWLNKFFDFIPHDLLHEERLRYLSKEELAKKVHEATLTERSQLITTKKLLAELAQKNQQMELQNKRLENNKMAMLNLLEDSRELERDLRVERDKAKAIVFSMKDGLFVVDKNYTVTLVNSVAEGLLGIPAKDMLGQHLPDIITIYRDGKILPKDQRPVGRTLRTGETIEAKISDNYSFTTQAVLKPVPISLVASPLQSDGVSGAVVVFRDITQEKESKEAIENEVIKRTRELEEEKAKLSASIEALLKAYIMTDLEGNVVRVNKNLSKLFGETEGGWTLTKIQERLGESYDILGAFKYCLTSKKRILDDGVSWGSKFLQIRLSPVFRALEGQELIGVLVIIGDVTEEKVMARSRDEFFSIASHELRTPLTAIKGNTSMILEYFSEEIKNPEVKSMLNDIHESSERLIGIVNDFLNISRLEQGRLKFVPTSFDLAELAGGVIKNYQNNVSEKGLYLRISGDEFPPKVFADPERVNEVLVNLIGNSIKFTDKGGIEISFKKDGEFVNVYIADSGRGIPLKNQSFLFHKFQQAGSSLITRDTTKGTGLGLYISKMLIDGMGGTIRLEKSEEGKGSTFSFSLPIAKTS